MIVWNITNNKGSSYNAMTREQLLNKYMRGEKIGVKEIIRQFCNHEYHINKIESATGEIIEDSHLRFD